MDDTASRRVLDLISGYWAAQAVYVATKLGVPDRVAVAPATVAELATATGAHERSLGQLCRYLVGLGIFDQSGDRLSLTPPGRMLLSGTPDSLNDLVIMYGEEFYQAWGNLLHNVRTGEPAFASTFGATMYTYFGEHPEAAQRFNGTMSGGFFFPDVARELDLAGARTVVDIAGGTGGLLAAVLRRHRHLTGVLFDLEHVIATAKNVIGTQDVADRVSYVAGDYTEEIPQAADAYLLSRILHSRTDTSCVDILRRCRETMDDDGQVVVVERTIPPVGTTSLGLAFDVHMMVLVGGCERSQAEYAQLLDRAGLALRSVHTLPLDMAALVARKAGA